MIHKAPNTSSTIVSKSISKNGGKVIYRGIVHFGRKAKGARSNIECDTLILDNESTSDTIPYEYLTIIFHWNTKLKFLKYQKNNYSI